MAAMTRLCVFVSPFGLLLAAVCSVLFAEPATDLSAPQQAPKVLRIVSLSPAISRMIVDMGLGDRIVGVAQHDQAAPANLPVVGNYLEVDTELLLRLRPTHVLTMMAKEGPPRQLRRLADHGRFTLVSYPSPLSVQDVANVLDPESVDEPADLPGLGTVLGYPEVARQVRRRMLEQLSGIEQITAGHTRPRVLMVLVTHPVMASGPGTTHHQLLTIAGAVNAAAQSRVGAPTYDREGLLLLQPELILILSPRGLPLESIDTDPRLAVFRGLNIPAVRNNRIVLLNDPLVLLPSSSIPRIAAAMARAIHPDLADLIDQVMSDSTATVESTHDQ